MNLCFILLNIRSAENVGSIFRTADAAGVSKIYLAGYTPGPLDRFNRLRRDVAKAALGAEATVPWEQVSAVGPLLKRLRAEGCTIAALEQDARSVEIGAYQPPANLALIVGNEVLGVPQKVRDACDVILEIPMKGTKESLNVAVAAGIAAFKLLEE